MVTRLLPTLKLLLPVIVTKEPLQFANASIFKLVTSFGTVTVYLKISGLNSGVGAYPPSPNDFNRASVDNESILFFLFIFTV